MKTPSGLRRLFATAALFAVASCPAFASSIILDNYTRTSAGENLSVPFTVPGVATSDAYSGVVEVLVSGTGYSLGPIINDAFHYVPGGYPLDGQYYQLNLGWTTNPLVPFSGEPNNINNFIVFVEGIGAVSNPYTPGYNPNNLYHFVVDTTLLGAQSLQFGVSDGNFGDNGGSYNITVWQLKEGASGVPDTPAYYTLAGLAFVLLLARLMDAQKNTQTRPIRLYSRDSR